MNYTLILKKTLFVCPMERSSENEKDAKHLFCNVWRRFLIIALNKVPIEAQKMLVNEYILDQLQPYFSNQTKKIWQCFSRKRSKRHFFHLHIFYGLLSLFKILEVKFLYLTHIETVPNVRISSASIWCPDISRCEAKSDLFPCYTQRFTQFLANLMQFLFWN